MQNLNPHDLLEAARAFLFAQEQAQAGHARLVLEGARAFLRLRGIMV